MQQDHVSTGWSLARTLRRPLACAPATAAAVAALREHVPGPGPDRHLAPELAAAEALVGGDALLGAVRAVTGGAPA